MSESMAPDEVIPNVGIWSHAGLIRLGMTRAEVQPLLDHDPDVRLDFRGFPERVAFIEYPKWWGTFQGIELFEDSADAVIAQIVEKLGLSPKDYPPGLHTYHFPELRMNLWRDTVSEEDGDQGFIFDSVSIYAPGYYDDVSTQ